MSAPEISVGSRRPPGAGLVDVRTLVYGGDNQLAPCPEVTGYLLPSQFADSCWKIKLSGLPDGEDNP